MDKEFLPPKEAIALKKLGFNEPCFKGFSQIVKGLNYFPNDNEGKNSDYNRVICMPLYQQVFEWFEKEHKLIGYAKPVRNFNHKTGYVYVIFEHSESKISEMFKTKKDAELACIKKLIKIVKQK